ncbi:type II toxin-antitoxin system PemK/MazF family toxin [Corynebacterium sp. SA-MJD20WY100]|uniref:type II toxin-antitoxin system PemK/MazF family toxin n=1 Tax=Corynebacterium sp. SA-MJD20WY100 TaxID=3142969 RepID=UPI0032213D3F
MATTAAQLPCEDPESVMEGQVWWLKPDPAIPAMGREQAGRRPVLVVSNDYFSGLIDSLFIGVPLTTKDRGWHNHIAVEYQDEVDAPPSWAMAEQIKACSVVRLDGNVGEVTSQCLAEVRQWISELTSDLDA